jgi:hypothetical protein
LNSVEILLRNSLDRFFTDLFKTPLWYGHLPLRMHQKETLKDKIKHLIEHRKIQVNAFKLDNPVGQIGYLGASADDVINILIKEKKLNTEPGLIVAATSFGFWTAFFHRDFEQFWRENPRMSKVFPYHPAPKAALFPKKLNTHFTAIRERLRNRVFHHEPIWNATSLLKNYLKVMETIYWLSPEKYRMLSLIDRFPEIYERGAEYYLRKLENI